MIQLIGFWCKTLYPMHPHAVEKGMGMPGMGMPGMGMPGMGMPLLQLRTRHK